jgi:predicted AAA+ superfamily ATPase
MKRLYLEIIEQHLTQHEQMLFLAGPRQVGKSTLCLEAAKFTDRYLYLNWDNLAHRKIILGTETEMLNLLKFNILSNYKPILVFDEIHKFKNWKNYLKGFYDIYKGKINIIVSGSAKLDIFRHGGDSLMGRYILYRIHPLSIREIIDAKVNFECISQPRILDSQLLNNLLEHGGYPEPFLKSNIRFTNQWKQLRAKQLIREDIQDISQIQNITQLELLAEILREQSTGLLNYTSIANDLRISVDTVKRWIDILSQFYYCFKLQPWHKNIKRSLLKEPKIFLYDWSLVRDPGKRIETMVAGHLLKAVDLWTDLGIGDFSLYFLRDKEQKEVDFLVTRDNTPWFMVEVKTSENRSLSANLYNFAQQLNIPHAFEIIFDKKYVDLDCFAHKGPIQVPLSTFLSQLC